MLRKMSNAELGFVALEMTVKAALEVRDAILAKREQLAELNNDIQEMLDEMFDANCSYATEIERIRTDFDDVIGEALTEPREFTDRSEPISDCSQHLPASAFLPFAVLHPQYRPDALLDALGPG